MVTAVKLATITKPVSDLCRRAAKTRFTKRERKGAAMASVSELEIFEESDSL
jgi:hypothetical protein